MRCIYQEQLSALNEQVAQMCGLAAAAIHRATQALLRADLALAEEVINDHERIMAMSAEVERRTVTLLARQQPVAGDLRAIVGSNKIIADVERMGRWRSMWPKSPGTATPNTRFLPTWRSTSPTWAGLQ
jgi:phosphate transport system protein